MKITLAAFALAALGSLSPPTAGAQTNTAAGSTSDGEPTFITPAEFAKRVHDGTLIPIIPSVLAQQKRRDHETLVHSWRVVDGYLRRHRDLTDLAQLVRLVPDLKDPALSRAPGP